VHETIISVQRSTPTKGIPWWGVDLGFEFLFSMIAWAEELATQKFKPDIRDFRNNLARIMDYVLTARFSR
jgi:hypothetical protein